MATTIVIDTAQFNGHIWIERPDGTIYDPDFCEYSFIKRIRNCSDEKVYKPLDIRDYPEVLKIVLQDWKQLKQLGMADWFYDMPRAYSCSRNAMAYKARHPECKLVYGSFGWKTKNGGEWLEFEV